MISLCTHSRKKELPFGSISSFNGSNNFPNDNTNKHKVNILDVNVLLDITSTESLPPNDPTNVIKLVTIAIIASTLY